MNMTILPHKYQSDTPCMNCKERHVNCHSSCEKYKKFRSICESKKVSIRKKMDNDLLANSYKIDSVRETKKRLRD